jgi:ribosomal protein S18 acetylase RimI-like enzyme
MADTAPFRIGEASSTGDLDAVAQLFRRYAASLDVDLAYQDFEAELASLPGKYAPPAGALMLARHPDGAALGCVALRPLDEPHVCEMKRLYVVPDARGLRLGRALVEAVVSEARRLGYREMRLDSLPSMASAIALYRRMDFVEMPPYYASPVRGTVFMCLQLGPQPT